MRNKIILVFLFSAIFILSSFSTQAYYDPAYPGSITNPLQVQDSALQQAEQRVRDQQLQIQQQYQQTLQNQQQQTQQQQYQQQLLDIQRKQLELQQNQQYNQKFQQESLTNNQACPNKYGVNSVWNGLFIGGGSIICDCKIGYQWNQEKTECVSLPSKIISSSGGSGGIKSTITCNGKEWNNCPIGQKFFCPSTGDAQCLISPKAETVKVIAPVVKKEEIESEKKIYNDICDSRGPNSYYYGFLNGPGDPACACIGGYTRGNLPTDPCIIKTASIDKEQTVDKKLVVSSNKDSGNIEIIQKEKEIKSKSFWTKLIGWFGF